MNHYDFHQIRYKPGRDYYMIGNGNLTGIIQFDPTGYETNDAAAPLVLFLQNADTFGIDWAFKHQTLLYDVKYGAEKTALSVIVDGRPFKPVPFNTKIKWNNDGLPIVEVIWWASYIRITEKFYAVKNLPVIYRDVEIQNNGDCYSDINIKVPFLPNHSYGFGKLYSDNCGIYADNKNFTLGVYGITSDVSVYCENHIEAHLYSNHLKVAPGEACFTDFGYILSSRQKINQIKSGEGIISRQDRLKRLSQEEQSRFKFDSSNKELIHLYQSAVRGLHAIPSSKGRINAGIWQYNAEWVRDSSMTALGSVHLGLFENAKKIFIRILKSLVAPDGRTAIMARFDEANPEQLEVEITGGFPVEEHEQLDQIGALLYALEKYYLWTEDSITLKDYKDKIFAMADRLITAKSRDIQTGLYCNRREYWERNSREHGITKGYELAYQVWPVIGLKAMHNICKVLDSCQSADLYVFEAEKTWSSIQNHSKLSFIRQEKFVKRLNMAGFVDNIITVDKSGDRFWELPLGNELNSYLEPCSSTVLPIVYGLIPADSEVSRTTLDFVEKLWNLRWEDGGYDRYHTSSECDTPGPWPFASLFMARANLLAGNIDRALKTLKWLCQCQGGKSGVWFEHIPITDCQRDAAGIVPWIWAEIAMFITKDLLGINPELEGISVKPSFMDDRINFSAEVRVRGKKLTIENNNVCWNGKNYKLNSEGVKLSY